MRVYFAGNPHSNITLHVSPAGDPEGIKGGTSADWLDDLGQPKNISVQFKNGSAVVPDDLGRYMLARKLVRKTAIIIPEGVAA